jgi:hypothetical protein
MGDNDEDDEDENEREGRFPNRSASGTKAPKNSNSLDMDDGFESSEEQDEGFNSTSQMEMEEELEDAAPTKNRKLAVMAMSLGKAGKVSR